MRRGRYGAGGSERDAAVSEKASHGFFDIFVCALVGLSSGCCCSAAALLLLMLLVVVVVVVTAAGVDVQLPGRHAGRLRGAAKVPVRRAAVLRLHRGRGEEQK